MNNQRSELQKEIDHHFFMLHFERMIPAFAWLYIIGDRAIFDYTNSQYMEHNQMQQLVKTAKAAEIVDHPVDNMFPLGLMLRWGDRKLAACGVNPDENKIIFFVAHHRNNLNQLDRQE